MSNFNEFGWLANVQAILQLSEMKTNGLIKGTVEFEPANTVDATNILIQIETKLSVTEIQYYEGHWYLDGETSTKMQADLKLANLLNVSYDDIFQEGIAI